MTIECLVDVFADLLVLEAVEEEDEDALERVQDGEHVGHGNGGLVQIQQSKRPRQTQQEHQNKRSTNPHPGIGQSRLFFALHHS